MTDTIAQTLGVEPVTIAPMVVDLPAVQQVVVGDGSSLDPEVQADVTFARQNAHIFIEQGKAALESALALAQAAESPRGIEAFAALLKSVSEVNNSLIDTHVKVSSIRAPKVEKTQSITNNAVFVGSTNELAKMIQGMKHG